MRLPDDYGEFERPRTRRFTERPWLWPRDKAEDDPSWTSGHDAREGLRRA